MYIDFFNDSKFNTKFVLIGFNGITFTIFNINLQSLHEILSGHLITFSPFDSTKILGFFIG